MGTQEHLDGTDGPVQHNGTSSPHEDMENWHGTEWQDDREASVAAHTNTTHGMHRSNPTHATTTGSHLENEDHVQNKKHNHYSDYVDTDRLRLHADECDCASPTVAPTN